MIETEVVIIGAGPVGLFQIFELGLLGIRAHVVESLSQPGGQCSELYPQKPIYDIPACPKIGAQELTDRLLEQVLPFDPVFHFNQEVTHLEQQSDGRFLLETNKGNQFLVESVVIAAGMGAFQPIKLRVEGINQFENRSVFYQIRQPESFQDKDLVILGGGDSALDWALEMQSIARSVLLVHRSTKFRAAPASVERMKELCDRYEMQSMTGSVTDFIVEDGGLKSVKITGNDSVTRIVSLDSLLVFFGLSPNVGALAEWGLKFVKNQIAVDTQKFQTSIAGIYAVGDINYYPGKKKLILSGFHEAALAAFAIKEQLQPDKKVYLQYTTTSPVMHKRLQLNDGEGSYTKAV